MSLGWIIFWKSVIVSVWALIVERWAAYKIKQNPERSVKLERIERISLRVFWIAFAVFNVYALFVVYVIIVYPESVMGPGAP